MKLISKLVSTKFFAFSVLSGVGAWFLIIPIFTDQLGANPIDRLLHVSGEIAIWTLGAVLSLTPLKVLFPHSSLVNGLNRHRRWIGVSACLYGLFHFGCHILYQGDVDDLLQSFSKPFTWFGLAGLSILVLLALTSNNWVIKKMGGKNWKMLHRLVYLAAVILLYHQTIAGKGHWYVSRYLIFSLLILESARIAKKYLSQRKLEQASRPVH